MANRGDEPSQSGNSTAELAQRICRVLEGLTLLEWKPTKEKFEELVYRYCHLVGGCQNPHLDWMKDFEETEKLVLAAMASPSEKAKMGDDITKSVKWYPIEFPGTRVSETVLEYDVIERVTETFGDEGQVVERKVEKLNEPGSSRESSGKEKEELVSPD